MSAIFQILSCLTSQDTDEALFGQKKPKMQFGMNGPYRRSNNPYRSFAGDRDRFAGKYRRKDRKCETGVAKLALFDPKYGRFDFKR